jgi:parvulin-like peptidyl-prolyl isomerase
MAKRQKQRRLTRKHLARQERERIQSRYILIGTLVVFTLVIILVGYGFIEEGILRPRRPVAEVEGEEITVAEFQERVRYQRFQLVRQYLSTYEFMQSFEDQSTQSFFQNNLQQIAFQLDPPVSLGRTVLDTMVEDILIRQEAQERGISVSQEEVEEEIQSFFGFYPDGTPTPVPTREIPPTSTLSLTQLALLPPTPTPTSSLTETTGLTETINLTQTAVVKDEIESTATPTGLSLEDTVTTPTGQTTPQPTPTAYTRQSFETDFRQVVDVLESEINFGEQELREYFEDQLYRQKMRDLITDDLEPMEEQVWARHILVEDGETAQEILSRLESGEDFSELAREVSTDPGSAANGGDLGWFSRGRMVPEFEIVAFDLEIGEISEPVQSQFGWHIIQVLGHEERPLEETAFEQLRDQEFRSWLETQRSASDVEINDVWQDVVPGEPSIPPQILPQAQPQPQPQPQE